MTRHLFTHQLKSDGPFPSPEGCSWRNYSPRHPVWVTDGAAASPSWGGVQLPSCCPLHLQCPRPSSSGLRETSRLSGASGRLTLLSSCLSPGQPGPPANAHLQGRGRGLDGSSGPPTRSPARRPGAVPGRLMARLGPSTASAHLIYSLLTRMFNLTHFPQNQGDFRDHVSCRAMLPQLLVSLLRASQTLRCQPETWASQSNAHGTPCRSDQSCLLKGMSLDLTPKPLGPSRSTSTWLTPVH